MHCIYKGLWAHKDKNRGMSNRSNTAWEWYHFCETTPTHVIPHYSCRCLSTHWGYGKHRDPSLSRLAGLLVRENRYTDLLLLMHPCDTAAN